MIASPRRRRTRVDSGRAINPVSYDRARAAESDIWGELRAVLDAGAVRVCDVGGGARPLLALPSGRALRAALRRHRRLRRAAQRAADGYRREQADILDAGGGQAPGAAEHGPFDAVFSRWTAEHVRDGERFHRHVFELLRPGGTAVHMFPTLYALPFLVNRMLPTGAVQRGAVPRLPSAAREVPPLLLLVPRPEPRPSSPGCARWASRSSATPATTATPSTAASSRWRPPSGPSSGVMVDHPLPALTSFALVVLRRPAEQPPLRAPGGRSRRASGAMLRRAPGRRRRSRSPDSARASSPAVAVEALAGVADGELAGDQEGPVAGLQREQLAQRRRPAPRAGREHLELGRAGPEGELGDPRRGPRREVPAGAPADGPPLLGRRRGQRPRLLQRQRRRRGAPARGPGGRPPRPRPPATRHPRTTSARAARCPARTPPGPRPAAGREPPRRRRAGARARGSRSRPRRPGRAPARPRGRRRPPALFQGLWWKVVRRW